MSQATDPFAEFGAFRTLFEGGPERVAAYLPLLGCYQAVDAVRRLLRAIEASGPDLDANLCALLLGSRNWRTHLVAAAAIVAVPPDARSIDALWEALDHFSWTSPQLAAAASRVDPSFLLNARIRLERRCSVAPPSSVEARGQSAEEHPDPKMMAALVALCWDRAPEEPWLSALIAEPNVASLLSQDRDHGDKIAQNWLHQLDVLLAEVRSTPG